MKMGFIMKLYSLVLLLVLSSFFTVSAHSEQIGEVTTTFNLIGANHKIVVEVFDDPEIPGVSCYLSRAKTGGISGSLGIAEDTSDASISCRKVTTKLTLPESMLKSKDSKPVEVFKKSTNIMFKKIQVVRFYDKKRNVLIYLTYSDKLIEGSPKNSTSVVPVSVD